MALKHYAFALTKTRGGWKVQSPILECASRGEADRASLRLMANYEETGAITLVDRELRAGEVLTAAELKRTEPRAAPPASRPPTASRATSRGRKS